MLTDNSQVSVSGKSHAGLSGQWKNSKKLGATKYCIVSLNQTCRKKSNIWAEPKHSGKLSILLITETVLN